MSRRESGAVKGDKFLQGGVAILNRLAREKMAFELRTEGSQRAS